MAEQPKDGGAAFPRPAPFDTHGMERTEPEPGMTLRQWYEGMAIAGAAKENLAQEDAAAIARNARLIATAMLTGEGLPPPERLPVPQGQAFEQHQALGQVLHEAEIALEALPSPDSIPSVSRPLREIIRLAGAAGAVAR